VLVVIESSTGLHVVVTSLAGAAFLSRSRDVHIFDSHILANRAITSGGHDILVGLSPWEFTFFLGKALRS